MILQDGFLFALSPYRHFERSREIFLARRLSCRMALLVCMFPTRSHAHHFPSCQEDPSASLGMTRREERYLSYVGANPLPFVPPSKGRGGTTLTLLPLEGGAPEGRRLASRMFDYPYPRIVILSEVEKSFWHIGFLAGWLYWVACFPCDLTLTIFPSARKIPRLRSG